jgi:hypothetical protein
LGVTVPHTRFCDVQLLPQPPQFALLVETGSSHPSSAVGGAGCEQLA